MKLMEGHVYRAKKPRRAGYIYYNDRKILSIDGDQIKYKNCAVRTATKFPVTTIEKFLKWAKEDVTDRMGPNGWEIYYENIKKGE